MNIFEIAAELDIDLDKEGLFECPHGGCGWSKGHEKDAKISLKWILDTCPECKENFRKLMNKKLIEIEKVRKATQEAIKLYGGTLRKLAKE